MASAKKPNKLVVISVITIWCVVIGQIIYYGFFNQAPEIPLTTPKVTAAFVKQEYNLNDTFELQIDYPDPFHIIKKPQKVIKKIKNALPPPIFDNTIIAPQIIYKGVISNQNNENQIFTIAIDQIEYTLKEGQSIENVKVIRGDVNSIILLVDNKRVKLRIAQGA
ncbi:hypothetical protein [Dokdonia sp. Hel_I_53]|uniref:hypothetical protein n=1 Tax=Dokdonia sp. Hel_I_53 TaxID=1566287 RepID=UPI00119C7534|nr:hypothetical protein [Dokdonia sp. Hel_I_53]TVZ52265.1 hypothetical protein OD90_1435 [Dokdonia sp. Hel_I_53]